MSLNDYTVAQLKQIARNAGQSGYSNLPKKSLLDLIGGIFSRKPSPPQPTNPQQPASPPQPTNPQQPTSSPRPASSPRPISGNTVRVPLIIPERTAPSTLGLLGEDVLYELAQNMDYEGLRNLCTSNRKYRAMCQTERFKRVIEQSHQKIIQDKVQQVLELIDARQSVTLNLPEKNGKYHVLEVWGPYPDGEQDHMSERINDNYFSSIIYRYLKQKLNFKGFENLTPEEYSDFITQTEFSIGKISGPNLTYLLANPIYGPFRLIFEMVDESGNSIEPNMYQLPQVKPDSTLISLQGVKRQDLIGILTLAFKYYPNAITRVGR